MILGLLATVVSALCYGCASVFQALAARAAPHTAQVDVRLMLRVAGRTTFLVGIVLDTLGFVAQFIALRYLPVFVVQAAQAASLAVTALVSVPLLKARLGAREWAAVAGVCAGLVLLVGSAGAEGARTAGTGVRLALLAAVVVLAVAGFLAGRLGGAHRSLVLGLVAGLGFGVVALAARALTDLSPAHLWRDPAAYALLAGSAVGFLFYTTALQRGSVTGTTAALIIGETLAPAVIGVLLLGDRTRPGFAAVAVAGFALAILGALALGRFGQAHPAAAPDPM